MKKDTKAKAKPKAEKVEEVEATPVVEMTKEKKHLYYLLEELKRLNIRSISDLENQIANAE